MVLGPLRPGRKNHPLGRTKDPTFIFLRMLRCVCVCVGIKEKPSFLAQGTVPWLTLSTDSGARSPGGPFPSPFWPCLVSPLRGLVLNIGKERKKGTTIRKLGGWDRSSSSGSFQDHQEKQDEEEAGKVPRSSSSVGVFFSSS